MKKVILVILAVCICLTISFGAAAAETTEVVETHDTEKGISITIHYSQLTQQKIPESYEYTNPKTKKTFTLPLLDASYSDGLITNRSGTVRGIIDYGWQSYIPKPLSEVEAVYYDEGSKTNVTAKIAFRELVQVQSFRWLDDVVATAVFEVYEAEYYLLKGTSDVYIPYNNLLPEIKGQESDIVKAINENPEYLRFLSAKWDGEVYVEDGVEKRDAVFYGERYVAQYVANYQSTIKLPDMHGYDCEAVYQLVFPISETTDTDIIEESPAVEAVPFRERNEIVSENDDTGMTVIQKILVTVSGVLLLSGLIVLIIYITRKRLAKKDYYEENDKVFRRRSRRAA